MHIVFLTNEYPSKTTSHGGIGTFVQNLARNLILQNIKVSVLGISNKEKKEVDNGVAIYRIKQSSIKFGKFIINSAKIRKKLKEIHSVNPIDIVEGSELSFAFLPKSTSYKKVIRMHGGHHFFAITLNKKPALWRSFQELKSFKKADALIAVSNYVGETTKQLVKFNLQFEVIYNFIDLERFKKSDTDLKEENTIVFIGTVCEKKGVKQLVEAFPLIKKKFPNVKLYLVGRDWKSKEIDSYINYLKEMISADDLKSIIFSGSIPYEQIPVMLEKAHVCVYPSHMESFGLTVIEAMAMAKPIVYSDIPPFNELITDQMSGLKCNPLNPKDIAEKIVKLLDNSERANEIGNKARIEMLEKFSPEKIVNQNIDFYKKNN